MRKITVEITLHDEEREDGALDDLIDQGKFAERVWNALCHEFPFTVCSAWEVKQTKATKRTEVA